MEFCWKFWLTQDRDGAQVCDQHTRRDGRDAHRLSTKEEILVRFLLGEEAIIHPDQDGHA